jgi:glycosyltransferase involved in cell wall biosynthesis
MARILEVISTPWPPEEGISTYVENLSHELVRRGHEVTVVTRGGPWGPSTVADNGITVIATPFLRAPPFHVDLHAFLMSGILDGSGDIDLVHCHSPLTLPPWGDTPVVSTFHSMMAASLRGFEVVDVGSLASRFMLPFSVRVESKLLRRSNAVTTVSKRARRTLMEDYGHAGQAIAVLGNGVDGERFAPARLRSCRKNALYVGRLAYGKGLHDLVRAVKLVLRQEPDWSFTLVGRGPLFSRLDRLRSDLGIPASRFRFRGYVPHARMGEEYRRADLLVLPSRHEGIPTALLEAMASGLPVVTTDVGGVGEIVEEGQQGLLCPPGNPDILAGRLLEAIQDTGLRERLGEAGRVRALDRFTWDRVANRWVEAVRHEVPGILT